MVTRTTTMHRHLLLLLALWLLGYRTILTNGCFEIEREALLTFKADIIDTDDRLSSWADQDCCSWRGVVCDNNTGHVVKLNLRDYALHGEINPSLLVLSHLIRLDLSRNNFSGISIPEFIGSFERLKHLDLSNSGFSGKVPQQLGNLSNIRFLDLSCSDDICVIPLRVDDLLWLSHLSSLRYLDMTSLNLSSAVNWLQEINKLRYLRELHLSDSSLSNIPNSLSYVNFTSLKALDLSYNGPFNTTLPTWLWDLTKLSYLNLYSSGFYGKISDSLGNLTSLNELYLGSNNDLEGPLPRSVRKLCSLRKINLYDLGIGGDIAELVGMLRCSWKSLEMLNLDNNMLHGNLSGWLEHMKNVTNVSLGYNSLVGPVPSEIGRHSNLIILDLSYNSLQGVISEDLFANLSKLQALMLSSNSLTIEVDEHWVPPFQIGRLWLGSCKLGPKFPEWLRWQTQLWDVDLSNTSIMGAVPEWFWNLPLSIVELSYNQVVGKLPASFRFLNLRNLFLTSNRFEGPIPSLPNTLVAMDLSENSFSGPLPPYAEIPSLEYLALSSNMINGSIPSYLCKLKFLKFLNLSNNYLSGEFPDCWQKSPLELLDLSNNNLSGNMPASMTLLSSLTSLHLNDNGFYGELPTDLQHCESLQFLDLSRNKFSGEIPTWIGKNLKNLVFLQLRSNMFVGNIPFNLAQLPYLHVLDLAHNNLSGSIPSSFGNFSAMILPLVDNYNPGMQITIVNTIISINFGDNLLLVMKGNEFQYSTILYLVKTVDLSRNNLSGQIPEEIVALQQLQSLNLSGNHLTGRIPEKIGDMLHMESLDLSLNELSGSIPQSLSALTYLSDLNLSYNNLSGRIPTGSQLDRLNDPSIYIGNYYLCGPPTTNNCSEDDANPNANGDDNNGIETIWLYLGMALGFVTGFWGVYGVLLFQRSWRIAYFQTIDKLYDKIYVIVALSLRRLKQKIGGKINGT